MFTELADFLAQPPDLLALTRSAAGVMLLSEGRGHKFESCRVRQTSNPYSGAYTTMHPRQANSFAVVAT
jgi:hypothetical protein